MKYAGYDDRRGLRKHLARLRVCRGGRDVIRFLWLSMVVQGRAPGGRLLDRPLDGG